MMKRFSDFAEPDGHFEGDKIKIQDILGQEIEILNFDIRKSKKNEGNLLTIQIRKDGNLNIIFTGSSVLSTQLTKYKSELPFFATIKQMGKMMSVG